MIFKWFWIIRMGQIILLIQIIFEIIWLSIDMISISMKIEIQMFEVSMNWLLFLENWKKKLNLTFEIIISIDDLDDFINFLKSSLNNIRLILPITMILDRSFIWSIRSLLLIRVKKSGADYISYSEGYCNIEKCFQNICRYMDLIRSFWKKILMIGIIIKQNRLSIILITI